MLDCNCRKYDNNAFSTFTYSLVAYWSKPLLVIDLKGSVMYSSCANTVIISHNILLTLIPVELLNWAPFKLLFQFLFLHLEWPTVRSMQH